MAKHLQSIPDLPFYDIKVVSIISLVDDVLVSFDYLFKHGIQNLGKLLLRYTQRAWVSFTFAEKTRWSVCMVVHTLNPSKPTKVVFITMYVLI